MLGMVGIADRLDELGVYVNPPQSSGEAARRHSGLLVLDASALVDLLAGSERAAQVRQRLHEADALAEPELVTVGTASALHRLARAGVLAEAEADQAMSAMATLPIRTVPHAAVLEAAWAPLLTTDARMSRAAFRGVTITLVPLSRCLPRRPTSRRTPPAARPGRPSWPPFGFDPTSAGFSHAADRLSTGRSGEAANVGGPP